MRSLLADAEAVLFDLDGTLVDTNIDFPLMKESTLLLAESYGLSRKELAGRAILEIVEEVRDRLAEDGRLGEARVFSTEAEELLEEIEVCHAQRTEPVEGAAELLEALRDARIKTGIVTRNCRKATDLSLELTGLSCDVVLTREDVERPKPDPSHLLAALDRLGAGPSRSLMIGDHTLDVVAGRTAGMWTVGFLRPNRPPSFFDAVSPDAVITSLRELLDELINLHR